MNRMHRSAFAALIATVVCSSSASATPITSNLLLWLDTSDSSSMTLESSGPITAAAWGNKAPGTSNVLANADKSSQPEVVEGPKGLSALHFDGVDDTLRDLAFNKSLSEATLFLVVAASSNAGDHRGIFSGNQAGQSDYITGLNVDLGAASTTAFNVLSVEGAKGGGGGGVQMRTTTSAFGEFHILQINLYKNAPTQLYVDGDAEGTRLASNLPMNLSQLRLGSRWNGLETGYFNGDIAAVMLYSGKMTTGEAGTTGAYLAETFDIQSTYVSGGAPAPEPGTLSVMGIGAAALLMRRRR